MRETQMVLEYLEQIVALLGTPAGLGVLLVMMGIGVAVLILPWVKWFCLTISTYAATLPLLASTTISYVPLAAPLEQFRAYARPIQFTFLGLLLLPLLTSVRGWRLRLVHLPLILFFLFQISILLRLLVFGNGGRSLIGFVIYSMLLLTLGVAVSRWLQSLKDFYTLLWCISFAGGLSALGTCYQLVLQSSVILANGRLIGVTGNPQHFAVILAFTLPVTCHLATRSLSFKWARPALVAQIAVMLLLLVWTGSRTGALSATIGVLVLFHRSLGRFLLLTPFILLGVWIALPYFEGSSAIASRIINGHNTRGEVWGFLFERFSNNVLLGADTNEVTALESSYLSALSNFGIIGTLPLWAAMLALVVQLVRLNANRRHLGDEHALIDLVAGVWAAIGIAAAFEGLLLGVGTFPIFLIYLLASATGFLTDWTQASRDTLEEPQQEYGLAA
ncbi:MAG TPA: hypothetical protein VF595_18385 [Tepidisphaeraceae bacterium]|jgi:hypothetical protein